MIAATIASAILAAMPQATGGDVTTLSSIRQWEDDSARGALTARRPSKATRKPAALVTPRPRKVLARWSCRTTRAALICRSNRNVKVAGNPYNVRATYVAFKANRTARTSVSVGRNDK